MWLAAGVEDPFRINICFWATELDVDLSDHSRFLGNHSIKDFQRDSLDQWSEQMKLPQCNAIGVRTPPSIWYAFGPYKEVSLIYLFIFSNLSDVLKKNERSGKHVQHLEVFLFFNLVHCSIHVIVTLQPFLNTPFPSSKPPPPLFCPVFLARNPINEKESKIPSDNTNAQPIASY